MGLSCHRWSGVSSGILMVFSVARVQRVQRKRFLRWMGLGHACGVRVDGAAPRGLWPPAGGGLCSLALRGRRPFGPTGPMDAICPSAPKAQAPAGIQESTSPPTGIYREMIHYRRVPRSFTLWRPCRGSPSQPKLALSLHIKGPSDCRLTDPG